MSVDKTFVSFSFCFFFFFLCSLLPALFTGCRPSDQRDRYPVIVVGSKQLTLEQLRREIEYLSAGMEMPVEERAGVNEQFIQQIVNNLLILEWGGREGIDLTDKEVEDAARALTNDYSAEDLKQALLREYVDIDQWRARLRRQLLRKKILNQAFKNVPPVSYEEIKEYFEAHRSEFDAPEMVEFRQIVTEDEKTAEELLSRLKRGENMEELARVYSIGPEAEDGGRVGWVERGHLDESMEKVLFSLVQDATSSVVKTPYGYHIFQVLSKRCQGVREIPEVAREIESKLMAQRNEKFLMQWLRELRSMFKVRIDRKLLKGLESA